MALGVDLSGTKAGRARVSRAGDLGLSLLRMTDIGRVWNYSFLVRSEDEKFEAELEQHEFNGDDAAESWGRELSKKHNSPIVVKRHSAHVDAWVYVGEVGEKAE